MTRLEPAADPSAGRPRRGQITARIAANVPLCREHFRLVLQLPSFPATTPGQFIQISCRDPSADYSPEIELPWRPGERLAEVGAELMRPLALLRRPFSLAGRRDTPQGVELDIIHRVVGVGTDWMSRLTPGDPVAILGPLGNSFQLPPPTSTAILVGGGVGIPPMLYLAEALHARPAVAFCGALSRDLLPLTVLREQDNAAEPQMTIQEFARHGIPTVITTDDGSYGSPGLVTQALESYLKSALSTQHSVLTLFTCGPEPMMKRVAAIASQRNLECQVAVERAMACGMGTCQSCCIRLRKPDLNQPPLVGKDWCYRLACTDGPIFRGELLW